MPFIAKLFDSVAPEVKKISSTLALRIFATLLRESFTAYSALDP